MKLISLLLACIPLLSFGQEAKFVKKTALPNGLSVHEYVLQNGMQILLVPDKSAPVITYQMWFKVGSASEKLDPNLNRTGLAHFFEHMMFRGTTKNPDQTFSTKLSVAGAVGKNASTSYDRTNYFESLPKEKLELAFELESDRMANLIIQEKPYKTELGAVIGELKMRKDKPSSVAGEELWSLAFEKLPYKYSVIGTLEELNGFTLADANYFYRTYYAPNNATLIVLGDISIPETLRLAEKYYGKMQAQKIPSPQVPAEPEQKEAKVKKLTHPLANSEFVLLGYKIPNMRSPDLPVLDLIASLLTIGNGSWLEQSLVQQNIASAVSSYASRNRYGSLFTIFFQIAKGRQSSDALPVLKKYVSRLQNGEISSEELERAKNQFLLESYGELLELDKIGRSLGDSLVASDDYLLDLANLEKVKSVSVEDIKRVANAYLTEERSNLVIVAPEKSAKGNK